MMPTSKNKVGLAKFCAPRPPLSKEWQHVKNKWLGEWFYHFEMKEYYIENNISFIESSPLHPKDWLRFKLNFIEEYGGEPVLSSGFTPSEFWEFLRSGYIAGNEYFYIRPYIYFPNGLPEDEE